MYNVDVTGLRGFSGTSERAPGYAPAQTQGEET
jgi:hypothetical protein